MEPCNRNDKRFIKPLLEQLKAEGISFKTVLADAQYDSAKARKTVREYDAEPVIQYRKRSTVRKTLKVGKDFIVRGVERLVGLFRKRVCIERVLSRVKEWLLLDHLRVRGLEQVFIHACSSPTAMLVVALTAVQQRKLNLIRSIKHYTIQ